MAAQTAIAFLTNAYQALGFMEYVHELGVGEGVVYLTTRGSHSERVRSYNTLMHAPGFRVRSRPADGWWSRTPQDRVEALVEELAGDIGTPPPGVTLILGDYRDPVPWALARRWGLAAEDVVVLDDGTWNASLDRSDLSVPLTEWKDLYSAGELQPLPTATFFTAFANEATFAAGDIVVPNRRGWLRDRYHDLPGGHVVLVVGQPFSAYRMMDPEVEAEVARELVETARALHPRGNVLYAAHEREGAEKLQAVAGYCDVVRFDVPLELVPVEAGLLPLGVVGHYSTSLTSFSDLAGDLVALHAKRIDPTAFTRLHDQIAHAYRSLAESHADAVSIVD